MLEIFHLIQSEHFACKLACETPAAKADPLMRSGDVQFGIVVEVKRKPHTNIETDKLLISNGRTDLELSHGRPR